MAVIRVLLVDDNAIVRRSKVLMLSYSEDEQLVTGAIRSGAAGYLVHGRFEPEELEARIKAVAGGEMVLSPAVTPAVFEALRRAPGTENESEELGMGSLTAREREVLNLLARGMSNAAIAEELVITNKTVKNHLSRIYEKMAVAAGEMVLSPAITPAVFEALRRAPGTENEGEELGMGSLTSREREVLNLLARGMSNAAIAEELVITNKTVKNHLSRIYEKIGVHSRAEAIALWLGVRER